MKDQISPQDLLLRLLDRKSRPERIKNLYLLHRICEAQSQGSCDFRIPAIGRIFESAGGIKARALNNKPSEDYRALINCWRSYSSPFIDSKHKEVSLDRDLISKISDPALRSVLQNIVAEKIRLGAELSLLKSVTEFVVDRRPSPFLTQEKEICSHTKFALSQTEVDALRTSISIDFIEAEGWAIGENGEVRKGRRNIFQIGFVDAIKKTLEFLELQGSI